MEMKYLYVIFCSLLLVNLFSDCGTAAVTSNEAETVTETPECIGEECMKKNESKCQGNGTECQDGVTTMVEEPMSNLVEEKGEEKKLEIETTTGHEDVETTTGHKDVIEETTTSLAENITVNIYYATADNDTDVGNLTEIILSGQENTTQIEYIADDNATDVTTIMTSTVDEMSMEFTTVNSTGYNDSNLIFNVTEQEDTTVKAEERDTTHVEDISTTIESVENITTTTIKSVENITVTTIVAEIITTPEPEVEISSTTSSTSDTSTSNATTTSSDTNTNSTNSTMESISSSNATSSMTSSTAEATSEDLQSLNAASHTSTEDDDDEQQQKIFIPIGVVGILALVGLIAYFLVRKMKKTATYECDPHS